MGEIQTLATHMLNGLAYGLLLFILAAGLSLIFGMMDVINLSHGSFYLVGGFLGVGLVDDLGNWWLALAVTVGIVAVLGLIAEDTGQSVETVAHDSSRDRMFTATEAVEYGFVDHVVESLEEIRPPAPRSLGLGVRA